MIKKLSIPEIIKNNQIGIKKYYKLLLIQLNY